MPCDRLARFGVVIVALAFVFSSCSRHGEMYRDNYESLSGQSEHLFRVALESGEIYDVRWISVRDDSITLDMPIAPRHDSRAYPVKYAESEVHSIEVSQARQATRAEGLVFVAVGVVLLGLAIGMGGF